MENQKTRRLSAIMFTDIVGYAAIMEQDEKLASNIRATHRQEFQHQHQIYHGEILQYYGDGTLSVFQSGVEAVECAIAIQKKLHEGKKVPLRIGLHMGDVVFDGTEVYGDGVNLASRIESMGVGGTVLLSGKLNDELKNQKDIKTTSLGHFEFKSIADPIEVFSVINEGIKIPKKTELGGKLKTTSKSIAVLPFVNMSSDGEAEYFSDGMTEEIINALSKIRGLEVTSRTSSFFFKNKNLPISEIGRELTVSTILEGSVRLSGQIVRITAQLINTADDVHFWSETWDRNLENIFEIQDEISLLIAEKLREHTGHFEIQEQLVTEKTKSIEAYENYLKGKFHYLKWNPKDMDLAITSFERAIALDPNFIEAHCAIAGCNIYLAATGNLPPEQAFMTAKKIVGRAFELNDQHAEVYSILGAISLWYDWNFEQANIYYEKAFQLQPSNAEVHQEIAMAMLVSGRKETALSHIKIAIKLDPLSVNHKFSEAFIYYLLRDNLNALDLCEKLLIIEPNSLITRIIHANCLLLENRQNEVIAYFEETTNPSIDISTKVGMLALAYVYNNDIENTEKQLALLQAQLSTDHAERALSFIFLIHAASGETNKALDYFEEALRNKSPLMLFLFDDPMLHPIMKEERYKRLVKKTFGIKAQASTVEEKSISKKKKSLLDPATSKQYSEKTIQLIEEKSPYLESSLTLRELAELTNIHPNHLSWLLNNHFGKSFNDFINHYRIEAFKRLALDPNNAHITLIGLAYESGFNSKTVFNTYFKKEMGMSPKAWMKSVIN